MTYNILSLAAFFVIMITIHVLGHSVACFIAGIKIEKIQIFYGKEIIKISSEYLPFSMGWIPTGGNVRYDTESFNEG